MRILLADDQKEIRILVTQQLESQGHRVVAVANGEKVLQALRRQIFDVVLLDEEMPGMSGTQVLRAIREGEKQYAASTVIAVTGYDTETDRDRLLSAGFQSVIGKPFRLDALEAILRNCATKEPLRTEEAPLGAVSASTKEGLLNRVGGDEQLLRRIVATFLQDAPKRLQEIRRAIRRRQGDKLASLSHAMKGPLGIFGADRAASYCRELQELGRKGDFAGAARGYESLKEEIAQLESNLRGYAGKKGASSPGVDLKTKRLIRGLKRKRR